MDGGKALALAMTEGHKGGRRCLEDINKDPQNGRHLRATTHLISLSL